MLWLLLAAALVVSQADPASVVTFPTDENGSLTCGQDQVSWSNQRSFDPNVPGSASLLVTSSEGSLIADLSRPLTAGERLVPLWCGDLLGDGSQVLGFESFSGGAHCCFSVSVVQLAKGAPHLLDADLGNGGLAAPQQLDGTGPLELVGGSDVFAYFDDLSFAASPFMPLVYAYDGAAYVEATSSFPGLIESRISEADAALGTAVARPAQPNVPPALQYQEQQSVALRLFGLHVLLGDADTALPAIAARLSPTAAAWLTTNAPAARQAMASVYNLSSPTSSSPSE
jgi:hypothetical protein